MSQKKPWGTEREPGACKLNGVCLLFRIQLHVETGFVKVFKGFGLFWNGVAVAHCRRAA
jgi:hypothetical protein